MTTAETPPEAAPPDAAGPDSSPAATGTAGPPVGDAGPDGATPAADGATPAADGAAAESAAEEPARRRRGRPKGSTARTTRTIELMLTVSGTADGDWQADLKQGSSWLSRGLPVSAGAVLRAARELHAEIAGPIDEAITAAREQRAARVAALEAELAEARKALAEIAGPTG